MSQSFHPLVKLKRDDNMSYTQLFTWHKTLSDDLKEDEKTTKHPGNPVQQK